jgi:hypothetical protein
MIDLPVVQDVSKSMDSIPAIGSSENKQVENESFAMLLALCLVTSTETGSVPTEEHKVEDTEKSYPEETEIQDYTITTLSNHPLTLFNPKIEIQDYTITTPNTLSTPNTLPILNSPTKSQPIESRVIETELQFIDSKKTIDTNKNQINRISELKLEDKVEEVAVEPSKITEDTNIETRHIQIPSIENEPKINDTKENKPKISDAHVSHLSKLRDIKSMYQFDHFPVTTPVEAKVDQSSPIIREVLELNRDKVVDLKNRETENRVSLPIPSSTSSLNLDKTIPTLKLNIDKTAPIPTLNIDETISTPTLNIDKTTPAPTLDTGLLLLSKQNNLPPKSDNIPMQVDLNALSPKSADQPIPSPDPVAFEQPFINKVMPKDPTIDLSNPLSVPIKPSNPKLLLPKEANNRVDLPIYSLNMPDLEDVSLTSRTKSPDTSSFDFKPVLIDFLLARKESPVSNNIIKLAKETIATNGSVPSIEDSTIDIISRPFSKESSLTFKEVVTGILPEEESKQSDILPVKSIETEIIPSLSVDSKRSFQSTSIHQLEEPISIQIARQIAIATPEVRPNEARTLHFSLNPESLGKVEVTVSTDTEGRLSADITVKDESARSLLTGNVSNLRETMERAGLLVDRLDISSEPTLNSNTGSHTGNQQSDSVPSYAPIISLSQEQAGNDGTDAIQDRERLLSLLA